MNGEKNLKQSNKMLIIKALVNNDIPIETLLSIRNLLIGYENITDEVVIATCENFEPEEDITIFHTDGSSLGNPGPGGWAIVCDSTNKLFPEAYENAGGEQHTTNSRMELKAIVEVFRIVGPHEKFIIYSDSKNTVDTINKNWNPKANLDLWHEYHKFSHDKDFKIRWEPRDSSEGNKRANAIAQAQAEKCKKESL